MDRPHSLLKRQIKKFLPEALRESGQLSDFLKAVNEVYFYFDEDRKLMERSLELNSQELLDINSRLRAMFDALPDYLIILDQNGKILDFKLSRDNWMGIKPELIIGRQLKNTVFKSAADRLLRQARKALEENFTDTIDLDIDVSGEKHYFEFRLTPLPDKKVLIIQRDITLAKESEIILKNREARYRTQFENASDAIMILRDGRFIDCNNKTLTMFKAKRTNIVGNIPSELSPDKQPDGMLSTEKAVGKINLALAGTEQIFEWIHKRADGELFDAIVKLNAFELDNDSYIMAMVQDVTDMKQTQRALLEEKDKLQVTLESISNGVLTADHKGVIILSNRTVEGILENRKLKGQKLSEVLPLVDEHNKESIKTKLEGLIRKGLEFEFNGLFEGKEKIKKIISLKGVPIFEFDGQIRGAVLAIDDITEKRRTEEEILNIKKIDSIGILAGGIAHDFNNLLTGILGNLTLSKLYLSKGKSIDDKLISAEQAALRAQDLTKQFLTFAKGGAPVKETASIAEIIQESVHFILRGSNVEAVFDIEADLWSVDIDKGQINQVINNLIINANQAMTQGGKIEISAKNTILMDKKIGKLGMGDYIMVSVKDHGIGISKSNIKRIFDPYFSTKPDGSGLGLASSFSIIKRHGGHISVQSELGKWTEFRIYLPASKGKVVSKKNDSRIKLGVGNILIMDDEEIIINILEEQLTLLGFSVVSVKNGNELMEVYSLMKEAGADFDLIMLDLTIKGGMGGEETIKEILKLDPTAKVIASSGYSNNPIMSNYKSYGFKGVIPKPYHIDLLSKEIFRVLKLKC